MFLGSLVSDYEVAIDAIDNDIWIKIRSMDGRIFIVVTNNNLSQILVDNIHVAHYRVACTFGEKCIGAWCPTCPHVLQRMIEYYQDRHPLMMTVNKLDYLRPTCHILAVKAKCLAFKKTAICKNWLLYAMGLLPRELVRIVCFKTITMFCAENRVLPRYGNVLLNCQNCQNGQNC